MNGQNWPMAIESGKDNLLTNRYDIDNLRALHAYRISSGLQSECRRCPYMNIHVINTDRGDGGGAEEDKSRSEIRGI